MARYENAIKDTTFEKEMYKTGTIPNIAGGIYLSTFLLYFNKDIFAGLPLTKCLILVGAAAILLFTIQFFAAPQLNKICTGRISDMVEQEKKGELDIKERTYLVKKLAKCPSVIFMEVSFTFLVGLILFLLVNIATIKLDLYSLIFFFVAGINGAHTLGLIAYSYADKLCLKKASAIVAKGIDAGHIDKHIHYGPSIRFKVMLYLVMPLFTSNLMQFMYLIKLYKLAAGQTWTSVDMAVLVIINSALTIFSAAMLFSRIKNTTAKINSVLEKISSNSLNTSSQLPTDLSDAISYNVLLVNRIIGYLAKMTGEARTAGSSILSATQNLSTSARETVGTASEENKSVKDCVTTMEKVKDELHKINDNITNVSEQAKLTHTDVEEGSELLMLSMQKIDEITNANLDAIAGIKVLSEKIEHVWSIIDIIDKIAERTRVIAYNAELEASSAGENGENFHIIATEIRRLADTITESTKEIRERITDIQHASDNLIITSEGGTEKIREGSDMFMTLDEKIKNLNISSEVTAESAEDIKKITNSQDAAFLQITITLQQISKGFDNFSQAASSISSSAENLRSIATKLNDIQNIKEVAQS